MSKIRRSLAVAAFLGVIAVVSSGLHGQQKKKATGTTPQATPATQVSQLAEAVDSRFSLPGVLTYQPVKGDVSFALKLQPKLEPVAPRPRDYVILLSTAATQAGPDWAAGHQIAEGIIETAREFDRVSIWTVNSPENTKHITKTFLQPKDYSEGKRLRESLKRYRENEFPAGDTDLKNALAQAIKTFDSGKERQRILLFLGDGLSTHNPMSAEDRQALARQMVERKIAFFPVPLGIQLDPTTLHGLANSTGGTVLRTRVEEELLVDALKRYEQSFAAPILYSAKLDFPADVSSVCPAVLPPLRSDSPTLVVGRMKSTPKSLTLSLTGMQPGVKAEVSLRTAEPVQAPDLENYFLVGMVDQWQKAKESSAILRADRALVSAYEQTRLQHIELLETAQMALQENKIDAAGRLFQQARQLAPHDNQAEAGVKIVQRLHDGTLTRDMIKKKVENRQGKGDLIKLENGKPHWVKVNLVELVQEDDKPAAKNAPPGAKLPDLGGENLLKEIRDRQAVEEQKIRLAVEEAIRQARLNLTKDPDGTLELLRNLLNRVKDHPEMGAMTRDELGNRLQTALRESAADAQRQKLNKQGAAAAASQAQANQFREQERKSYVDRVQSQFLVYKNLMAAARFDETRKTAIIEAMIQIQDDARMKGQTAPTATKAMYDIALAAYPMQQNANLVRLRERQWLSVLMQVEKAHIPYPDEPGIYFPPLVTWKALIKARKNKYEVTSLPDDPEGRKESSEIYQMLQQPVKVKALQDDKIKLEKALNYFSDVFKGKLSIFVDKAAFQSDAADAPDLYDQEVQLPRGPEVMAVETALRLMLSQVGNGKATYVIRRKFIEITTVDRYLEDKVLRVYPVGDLVMPLSTPPNMMAMFQAQQQQGPPVFLRAPIPLDPFGNILANPQAGGMGGMGMGMGMPGMGMGMGMGGGGMGMGMGMPGMGMGMGMGGGMGMGMGGGMGMGMGMPGMGMGMGMGMPGMGMGGGMGMGMPGMGMGMGMGMPGMGMGMGMGMPGMGMGMGMGMPGMGMGMGMGGGMGMGMGGGMGGQFTGASFQGSFNGGLGMLGATQAMGLIDVITSLVDPGNWNKPKALSPFMPMAFPGMLPGQMMVGMPPPDPGQEAPDPKTSNTINFFPPAMALIVRAPSRIHTSINGGIIGGRSKIVEKAAFLNDPKNEKVLALAQKDNNAKIKVGPDREGDKNAPKIAKKDLDPTKVWNEGFAKGGVTAGLVIATADFLLDAGEPKHAAEFLKANLRYGVVTRPWVFEALAIALELSGGDPEEIRRARLSGIAMDPNDAQGFMSAARAMADRGEHERALAFCRQAALLEPNDYHPYEVALAYAESSKDAKAMEWAVGKLVSQDWPVDNLFIHKNAQKRLESLTTVLKSEKRVAEANRLQAAIQLLNQRDLMVRLLWDNANGPSELEMNVKEPCGSVCSLDQKQTTGGGIMIGYNLTDKEPNAQYVASQAFSGEYEITISRVYGQPLGNRARLEIIQNAGTPRQVRRLEVIRLDANVPIKFTIKDGRRTDLAVVSPAAQQRRVTAAEEKGSGNAFNDLRAIANPNYFGATGPRGGAGTPGANVPTPTVASLAARDSKNKAPTAIAQNAVTSPAGLGGVQMTSSVRISQDQRTMDMVIRPFFQSMGAATNRPAVNLSGIPGGAN